MFERKTILRVLDFFCYRLTNILASLMRIRLRRVADEGGGKRILVIADDRLGDALVRMPFYAALRKRFPRGSYVISIVVARPVDQLFARMPFFDEIIVEDATALHSILWFFNGKFKVRRLLKWSRARKVDILVNLVRMRALGYDYVRRMLAPRVSIAYSEDGLAALYPMTGAYQRRRETSCYTHVVPFRNDMAQTEDLKLFLRLAAGSDAEFEPVPRDLWAKFLDVDGGKGGTGKPIVLVPGSNMPYRRWPEGRFRELAAALLEKFPDAEIVVAGTAGERPLGDAVAAASPGRIRNLCGKTGLVELGRLLLGARLVVSNETGTATYAAVVGAPTVVVLGGGDFGVFFPAPFYRNTASAFSKRECFNCGWRCRECDLQRQTAPCIGDVSVAEVLSAALSL